MNWGEVGRLLALGWPIAAAVMGALWLRQKRTRDATSVDIAWSALLGLFAVVYALLRDGDAARRALAAATVAWMLAVALSLPFALACTSPAPLGPLDFAALALWPVSLVGEGVADRQLAHFERDAANRGRTCRSGLWPFSRHPNYFFQWRLWIACALFGVWAPWGAAGFAAPLAMLGSILFVTGIPPTEAQALRSRGDDYREYQRTTSALVPWLPSQVKRTT